MQRASKVIISRIQNRMGLRRNLPQPLKPGEIALTSDSRQVWIGNDDVPPYGVRTYNSEVNIVLINEQLESQALSVTFEETISDAQFQIMLDYFSRLNANLFLPVAGPDPAVNYNQTLQLLWDGERKVFFGLRQAELDLAASAGLPWSTWWLSDPAAAMGEFLDLNPSLPARESVETLSEEFNRNQLTGELEWQGRPGLNRVLLADSSEFKATASGNAARIINIIASTTAAAEEFVTTLGNIEIGTIDDFQAFTELTQDSLFLEPFQFQLAPTATMQPVGFAVNAQESDTLFIEYALTTPTSAAAGTLKLSSYDANNVVIMDDRTDTEEIDVTLTADASGGTMFLEYINNESFNVQLTFIVRRWSSLSV